MISRFQRYDFTSENAQTKSYSSNLDCLGPYGFHDAENADGLVESSHLLHNKECQGIWLVQG